MTVSRNDQQLELVSTSPTIRQCEKDENDGKIYSEDCRKARSEAASMNNIHFTMDYRRADNLPDWLFSYLDDLTTYQLYPFITDKRYNVGSHKRIEIKAEVDPKFADLSLLIDGQDDVTTFTKIPVPKLIIPSAPTWETGISHSLRQVTHGYWNRKSYSCLFTVNVRVLPFTVKL